MIFHFLKRDILNNRLSWILLILMSLIYFPARAYQIDILGVLAYFYLIFPLIALRQIAGVNWRSQHTMSRNYLLSLPVSRNRMFNMVMVRSLVFCLPAFAVCLMAPYYWPPIYEFFVISTFFWVWALIMACGFFWFVGLAISMQIGIERITSHLTVQQRMWSWFKYISIYVIEVMAFLSVIILLAELTPEWFPVVGAVLFARVRFVLARALWLGK